MYISVKASLQKYFPMAYIALPTTHLTIRKEGTNLPRFTSQKMNKMLFDPCFDDWSNNQVVYGFSHFLFIQNFSKQ
jgi:hypothetical protein